MSVTEAVMELIRLAFSMAELRSYEYVTPEGILLALCEDPAFIEAFRNNGGDLDELKKNLEAYLDEYVKVPSDQTDSSADEGSPEEGPDSDEEGGLSEDEFPQELRGPIFSAASEQVMMTAQLSAQNSGRSSIALRHILRGIYRLKDSYAVYYMNIQEIEEVDLLQSLSLIEEMHHEPDGFFDDGRQDTQMGAGASGGLSMVADGEAEEMPEAPCLNDTLTDANPLIGREEELERTIQILCRKEKNNPLHIGEPGVGKTAVTYGLVELLKKNEVPEPLKGAKVFAFDLGSMLAGTQYRGEFEKKMKRLLEKIGQEDKPIVYIDEIHNIVGTGGTGESSFDVSNMLKPYLAEGKIRFIGATTYEEYKKHFEKSKGMVRRFQNVEIVEPTVEETVRILEGLRENYEKFHGIKYQKGVLEYAVQMSAKYINERFLPDKAIDLIDEAGAWRRIHPQDKKVQTVGKDVINQVLRKICRVPIEVVQKDENTRLATLEKRILAKVYGQDEAVTQVVNAVKFSRAGLLEDHKPMSSFLFAGPTGVGKTEVARTLAEELGVQLVRFDMSEYGEKHSVSKLIGAPAGYIGYEEGGLLTEAIRKNPSCVLLLDEIEKAHPEIFNILLQIMDYATLTDNQGRKADFRNVILIMTSNAGANQIGKSRIGFHSKSMTSEVVLEAVNRLFQPEFRNRLNRIVTFSGMTDEMAGMIAGRKLRELEQLLKKKNVELRHTKKAVALLQEKGVSREYGARELDRVIQNEVKTLLVDEILFGSLKKGGRCRLDEKDGEFVVRMVQSTGKQSDEKADVSSESEGKE